MLESVRFENGAPSHPWAASLPVEQQRPLAEEERACLGSIVKRILDQKSRVIAIEGDPGTGKTTLSDRLARVLEQIGVPVGRVSTDDDVLPRSQRSGREIVRFHPGAIARELIGIQFSPNCPDGARFTATCYNGASGEQDKVKHFYAPGEHGVLLVEGLTASEVLIGELGRFTDAARERALCVLLDRHRQAAEAQRIWRDTLVKGLPLEEVEARLRQQRGILFHYQTDNRNDWAHSGTVMGREQHRLLLPQRREWDHPSRYPGEPGFVGYKARVQGPVSGADFRRLLHLLIPDPAARLGVVIKVENGEGPDPQRYVLTPSSSGVLDPTFRSLAGPSTIKIYSPANAKRDDTIEWHREHGDPVLVRAVA